MPFAGIQMLLSTEGRVSTRIILSACGQGQEGGMIVQAGAGLVTCVCQSHATNHASSRLMLAHAYVYAVQNYSVRQH